MKLFSQSFNQLTEIHAAIGGVIENSFCLIPLIFNVIQLHLKLQTRCYLAAAVQSVFLLADGFEELLHIVDARATVNFPQFTYRSVVFLAFALFLDEFAHHCHNADVVSDGCLNRNQFTFKEMHLRRIAEKVFSVVFETHFRHHKFSFFRGGVFIILEPVKAVELALSVMQDVARKLIRFGFYAASAVKIIGLGLLHVVVQRPRRFKFLALVLFVQHPVLHLLVFHVEFLRRRFQQTVNVFSAFAYIFVKNFFFIKNFVFHKIKKLLYINLTRKDSENYITNVKFCNFAP